MKDHWTKLERKVKLSDWEGKLLLEKVRILKVENVSFLIALGGGILSFLSPCVLPLVPSYLSFVTGISLDELLAEKKNPQVRKRALLHSLMFVLGFSVVFTLLGASASLVGRILLQYQLWIARIGGVFIVFLGIHFTGVIKWNFLQKEKRLHLKVKPAGYLDSFLVGVAFAAGWTPCVGPILASILLYASTADSLLLGVALLAVYSVGFAIPFLLISLGLGKFLERYGKVKRRLRWISVIGGLFLIGAGILLITDYFFALTALLNRWFPFLSELSL